MNLTRQWGAQGGGGGRITVQRRGFLKAVRVISAAPQIAGTPSVESAKQHPSLLHQTRLRHVPLSTGTYHNGRAE